MGLSGSQIGKKDIIIARHAASLAISWHNLQQRTPNIINVRGVSTQDFDSGKKPRRDAQGRSILPPLRSRNRDGYYDSSRGLTADESYYEGDGYPMGYSYGTPMPGMPDPRDGDPRFAPPLGDPAQQQMGGPQQPLPREIYRRRRVVALVLLVVVIALLAWGISALVKKSSGSSHQAAPSTVVVSTTSTHTQKPAPAGPACDPSVVAIEAQVNDATVVQGSQFPLILKVTNSSDAACSVDVGASQQRYEVYTAEEGAPVWKSEICYTSDETKVETLQPGESRRYTVNWEGTRRNADGDCSSSAPTAAPGSYQLYTRLGDHASEPVIFTVTPRTGHSRR